VNSGPPTAAEYRLPDGHGKPKSLDSGQDSAIYSVATEPPRWEVEASIYYAFGTPWENGTSVLLNALECSRVEA